MKEVEGTPYEVDENFVTVVGEIAKRVSEMRSKGALSREVLGRLRKFFRIKNIYHSNAIEGNQLDVGETRLVVEQGLTLTGRPLKDQAEAKNLSSAIDFLEQLAGDPSVPFTEADLRQMHHLVLRDIRDSDAGKYRTVPVEISGSEYKPPGPEAVPADMHEFCSWLSEASVPSGKWSNDDAILVAAAAHTWFVTIHPFVDGNGRVGRLLLNLILMRYGYPIAIITKADRSRYYDSLEISQTSDLTAMGVLLFECLEESLEEYEVAASEQREHEEWAKSVVSRYQEKDRVVASNQYEVWRSAMDLLKNVFRHTTELLNMPAMPVDVWLKDFGHLELEKYLALKSYASAKKTWFFRVDFKSGEKTARYLFFFGSPSYVLKNRTDVVLHVAREEPAGSFYYERVEQITATNVPSLAEIGYNASQEEFITRRLPQSVTVSKIEESCRVFFEEVLKKHFGI